MRIRNLIFITIILLIFAFAGYNYFDGLSLDFAVNHQLPIIAKVAGIVQHAFSFSIWSFLTVLILIVLWWRSENFKHFMKRPATQFWLALLIAMCICFVLKTSLGRYRPEMFLQHHLYGFSGFTTDYLRLSMPSDHSALIFSMVTSLSYFARSKFVTVLLCVLGILLVATRVLFLKHYPSDVFVGMLAGIWASYIAYYFCNWFRQTK